MTKFRNIVANSENPAACLLHHSMLIGFPEFPKSKGIAVKYSKNATARAPFYPVVGMFVIKNLRYRPVYRKDHTDIIGIPTLKWKIPYRNLP